MKINKLWSIMTMLVLVLGTTISFSSCSDDDEDSDLLIGTWKRGMGWFLFAGNGDYCYHLYTFQKDGTMVVYELNEHVVDYKVTDTKKEFKCNGDYRFDNTGRITIRYDMYTYSYLVTHIDEKSMSWMDSDGEIEVLDRQ